MSEPQKPIIPPQKELKEEIRRLAQAEGSARCSRCGESGQRFLRRCPKCGRRHRSVRNRVLSPTKVPGHW